MVRIRVFQQLMIKDMKKLIDIMSDPLREAAPRDYIIASLVILVPLCGIIAMIIDTIPAYVCASVALGYVAYKTRRLK